MPEEEKESLRYNITDNIKERFYQLPKGLFLYPRYRGLDPQAKIMYAILRDRLQLSKINGWFDKNGDIYLVFTQEKLSDLMGFSQSAVSKTMKKLEDIGLLEKSKGMEKTKNGYFTNIRIYVNKLIVPDQSEILEDVSEANLISKDNREQLESSLHELDQKEEQAKEQKVEDKEQKIKDKQQKVKLFPQEYPEVQKRTTGYSSGNTVGTRKNTELFPQEYPEVQKRTAGYSSGNNGIFPQEYGDIPIGINPYSSGNTIDTDKYSKTYNNKTKDKDITHNSSIPKQSYRNKEEHKPNAQTETDIASLMELVKSEIYAEASQLPPQVMHDIITAYGLYSMDMIQKAVDKTKRFHKHHFAYTLKILESWQQKINEGNPTPWVLPKGSQRIGVPVVKITSGPLPGLPEDLDEWERNQKFPWDESF